jgi:nitrate/nitrite transport system permease protein
MNEAQALRPESVAELQSPVAPTKSSERSRRVRDSLVGGAQNLAWSAASLALMLGAWALISSTIGRDLPSPLDAARTLSELCRNPFGQDDNGPRIGVQVLASLKRVLSGFVLGSLAAIPLGVLMGSSPVFKRLFDPIVQILRPVSPLVWFPLSLVTFKSLGGVGSATLFTIFITSLWPTLINTAFGVGSLPQDYKNVARVFQFSRGRTLRRIVLPYALPHIITGLRLSMGIAWLVIVAAEMLSGDMGVGFFAWESYNAGSYDKMVAAVVLIGGVGLILDRLFDRVLKKVTYA